MTAKKRTATARPIRVGMVSLGCAKNLVDAEIMLGAIAQGGMEITNDAELADVVIVNTCSFIDSAQEESVDTILESAAVRDAKNRGQGLIVSGCLSQRFRDELPKLFPEVDAFMGIDQVAQVPEIVRGALEHRAAKLKALSSRFKVQGSKSKALARFAELDKTRAVSGHEADESLRGTEQFGKTKSILAPANHQSSIINRKSGAPFFDVTARPVYIPDYATPRFRLTPRHFAYVKIAEGCNHPCSFCIIPRMRGSHRSRAQADVVREARALLADGVKELNLISQDSTYYGLDLRPGHSRAISSPEKFSAAAKSLPADATTLCTLIRDLNALDGDFWIRLLYTHPAHWTDELIATIAACPKVARYVDIPLQHIHDTMLQRMRRETSGQYIRDLIARIRAGIPGIALRTTFIVGFPGETEEYFETLLGFIRDTQFERLGVFAYSQEEGTIAGKMSDQLPDKLKQERRARAMAEQHKVARAVAESFVGRTLKVLVEGEASAKELKQANIRSWEHGLIRERDSHTAQLKGRYLIARGEADAPDIDGRVYIRGTLPLGEFAHVRVIGHTDYDLIAEPVVG
ncbi:MAG TPA: 30S ribosomal protein S12 methylthiotransferase RimO [Verrucomicrobiae bacterium]